MAIEDKKFQSKETGAQKGISHAARTEKNKK
jgi:hypothetical protein